MNPPLSLTDATTQLKLLTSQTGNFTFTDDELTLALQQAWNDPYVVNDVWDSSITYLTGTWQYAIPATLTTVKEIYIILPDFTPETTPPQTSSQYPGRLDKSLWEVVAGNIQLAEDAQRYIGSDHTLYLRGNYKLTTSDSLGTTGLVNYTLNLAAQILLSQLLLKKAFVFLTNDTSVQEIIAAQQVVQGNVLRYKQGLPRTFESV